MDPKTFASLGLSSKMIAVAVVIVGAFYVYKTSLEVVLLNHNIKLAKRALEKNA